jgi:hypothetical protein
VAVVIVGHMRTFDLCLPTIRHHVLRHFPEAHVLVSTVDDADAPKTELLRQFVPEERLRIHRVPSQPVIPLPEGCPPEESWTPGVPFMHEPFAISVPPQAVLRQLWQLNEARLELAHWAVGLGGNPFDVVIRLRPDSWFHSAYDLLAAVNVLSDGGPLSPCFSPLWGGFGGINDRFAIMGMGTADAYLRTFVDLNFLIAGGCPLHPESLIYTNVMQWNGHHRFLRGTTFSTLKRVDGQIECRPPEVTPFDYLRAG